MTTITAFVPDWNANEELKELARGRKGLEGYVGKLRGYDLRFSQIQGCDVIQLDLRAETMPRALHDVPMRSIMVIKPDSPSTLTDGRYEDGAITARVETSVNDNGVRLQLIKVTGTAGTTVEELNQWFDDLLAGKKADKNVTPITYPPAEPGGSEILLGDRVK